jgi:acetamidase/formamidase
MFGCGTASGPLRFDQEFIDATLTERVEDRLERNDGIRRERYEELKESRVVSRRGLLKAGAAATVATALPLVTAEAALADDDEPRRLPAPPQRKVVTIPSVRGTGGTVVLGQFDTTREPVATVESGDTISYPKTMTHFLGAIQPGVPIETIAALRVANPGKGPHSVIGPVAVRGAAIGDVLEVFFHRLRPVSFGFNFNNPGSLNTGALPDLFPNGQVKYFALDDDEMTTRFNEDITLPLAPFQGIFGLRQPVEFGDIVRSVPPDRHAGNLDLRHLNEGTKLFIPVWRPGALIFTGDSHVLQGDGEVNLTAIESAMKEVRVTVTLHKGALAAVPEPQRWPIAETATEWKAKLRTISVV